MYLDPKDINPNFDKSEDAKDIDDEDWKAQKTTTTKEQLKTATIRLSKLNRILFPLLSFFFLLFSPLSSLSLFSPTENPLHKYGTKANEDTVNLAHTEAMKFGTALRQLLFQIYRANPKWGPVYMSKTDIKDGFYNVCVNSNGVKKFGIVLPAKPGQETLILFFLGLPMGWVASPPVFCACTKTICDVAQAKINANRQPLPLCVPGQGGRQADAGPSSAVRPRSESADSAPPEDPAEKE